MLLQNQHTTTSSFTADFFTGSNIFLRLKCNVALSFPSTDHQQCTSVICWYHLQVFCQLCHHGESGECPKTWCGFFTRVSWAQLIVLCVTETVFISVFLLAWQNVLFSLYFLWTCFFETFTIKKTDAFGHVLMSFGCFILSPASWSTTSNSWEFS